MDNILKQFQIIPSVGKAVSKDLYDLGYRSVAELKEQNGTLSSAS